MPIALVRIAAVAVLLAPAFGFAQEYFVRINNAAGGLYVDSLTATTLDQNSSLGSATRSVDLSDGSLRTFLQATDPRNTLTTYIDFGDTITIIGVTNPTTVTVQMRVTGTLSGTIPSVTAFLQIGDGGFSCTTALCALVPVSQQQFNQWSTPGTTSVDQTFSLDVPVSVADPTFSVLGRLIAYANGPDGVVNFGNSAEIALVLPDGLSFSSASGVFLTSPVPEPSSVLAFCVGLAAVFGASKRQNRQG